MSRHAAKSILIVEDHPVFVDYLRRLIGESGIDATITVADKISDAEFLMSRNRYSCVLLDLNLKNGAGKEVILRALRFQQPLIVVTASEEEETRKMALQNGAQEFIEKSKLANNGPEIIARLIENSIDRGQGVAQLISAYCRGCVEAHLAARQGAANGGT